MELDTFTQSYIAAALWSTIDDNDEPLENSFNNEDLAEETLAKMVEDCKHFREQNKTALEGITDERAGFLFWLNRNYHGSGFWDEGLGERGKALNKASHTFGTYDLEVGDDGKVHGREACNESPTQSECYCDCGQGRMIGFPVSVVTRREKVKGVRKFQHVRHYFLEVQKLATCGYTTTFVPGVEIKVGDVIHVTCEPDYNRGALGGWKVVEFYGATARCEKIHGIA